MAWLVATMAANAEQKTEEFRPGDSGFHLINPDTKVLTPLPAGTVRKATVFPQDRIQIPHDHITAVCHVNLDQGVWSVSGALNYQDTVAGFFDSTHFIYKYSGISRFPDRVASDGIYLTDAKWYATQWFPSTPPTTVFVFNGEPRVYLNTLSHTEPGHPPPFPCEVYGGLVAVKITN